MKVLISLLPVLFSALLGFILQHSGADIQPAMYWLMGSLGTQVSFVIIGSLR